MCCNRQRYSGAENIYNKILSFTYVFSWFEVLLFFLSILHKNHPTFFFSKVSFSKHIVYLMQLYPLKLNLCAFLEGVIIICHLEKKKKNTPDHFIVIKIVVFLSINRNIPKHACFDNKLWLYDKYV